MTDFFKRLGGLASALLMLVALLVPVLVLLAMFGGMLSMAFDEPQSLLAIAVYAVGVITVVGASAFLLTHPKTAGVARFVVGVLLVLVVVRFCAMQLGKLPEGNCVPSRYVTCD